MRYQVKYIGFGVHGVVDTEAPESVCGDASQGHLLLWCLNGRQPCQIAADALNAWAITAAKWDSMRPRCPTLRQSRGRE